MYIWSSICVLYMCIYRVGMYSHFCTSEHKKDKPKSNENDYLWNIWDWVEKNGSDSLQLRLTYHPELREGTRGLGSQWGGRQYTGRRVRTNVW